MQHLKDGKWSQMSQKQVDKVKEGDNFKVRWFIKKEMTDENGETKLGFEFLPAKSEFSIFFLTSLGGGEGGQTPPRFSKEL